MLLVPLSRNPSELARRFDRLFDDGFDRFFAATQGKPLRAPALDVAESEQATPSSSTCPAWPRKT